MQQDAVWRAVLGEIELSVSSGVYNTWFAKTKILQCSDELIVIGVLNGFAVGQFERHYTSLITELLAKNGVTPVRIEYRPLPTKKAPEEDLDTLLVAAPVGQSTKPGRSQKPVQRIINDPLPNPAAGGSLSLSHDYRQGLNEQYSMDNFVVGASNELAFAACQSIVKNPGVKYNPLFLYGGVGIGKTHLIQATGNAYLKENPGAKVVYITTEQFVQEFVDAIKYRKTSEFSSHYRSADILIIDDIQFLAGKDKMEEEFFHTFNALHQANKQLIISSDRPPREIPTIHERLSSRLEWGMHIDMQVPDFETRCAILQTKATEAGMNLPFDAAEYLATNFQNNIRELEGELNRVLAFCEMRGLAPDLTIVKSMVSGTKRPKHLSAKQVIERTARHFQVPVEEVMGSKRDKDIVVPRQVAMYLLRDELKLSLPKIAEALGRKDHTTAMHSVNKITQELAFDPYLRDAVNEIKEHLYA